MSAAGVSMQNKERAHDVAIHQNMSTASESESDLPDPVHEAFTALSIEQRIRINKVQASRVPRGGLGIIAQRRVEVHCFGDLLCWSSRAECGIGRR